MKNTDKINALFINCTLKKSPDRSHTQTLMDLSIKMMESEGVQVECIRLADHEVPPGVQPDMAENGNSKDEWPAIFEKVKSSHILVIGTPIWLGEKSSIASKLIERLYGMSSFQNKKGQYIYYGKVGGCIVTGNEDGIKHVSRGVLYSLQHMGYSIPPQADAGWIGEVGPGPSYGDTVWKGEKVDPPVGFDSDFTNKNITFMTYNLIHLAKMLKVNGGYPAIGNSSREWEDGTRWNFEDPEYR